MLHSCGVNFTSALGGVWVCGLQSSHSVSVSSCVYASFLSHEYSKEGALRLRGERVQLASTRAHPRPITANPAGRQSQLAGKSRSMEAASKLVAASKAMN
jgi:hypothetical protein